MMLAPSTGCSSEIVCRKAYRIATFKIAIDPNISSKQHFEGFNSKKTTA